MAAVAAAAVAVAAAINYFADIYLLFVGKKPDSRAETVCGVSNH